MILLEPSQSLAALARTAAARGAGELGMAGGDGSLAEVAAVAVDNALPLVCVPAGTRSHFALDLGVTLEAVPRHAGEPDVAVG